MPSPIEVNIKMEPYLIQYMESIYGHQPITFPRKDRLAGILPMLLCRPKEGDDQFVKYDQRHNLRIVLPYFEDKNVLYHNYIPPSGQKMFERMVYRMFKALFHDFMNEAQAARVTMKESIDTFIDIYHLDPSATDQLIKERQRYKSNMHLNKWREKKRRQYTDRFVLNDTE